MQPNLPVDPEPNIPRGFRLDQLQILRWGTFDGPNYHTVNARSLSACLTGANGSGKTTALDALATLLIPPDYLAYNVAASGDGSKRDRNKRSYIRGAWSRKEAGDSGVAATEYLRLPGTLSVILAVFTDRFMQRSVTLAQILWVTSANTWETRYLIRETAANIPDLKLNEASVGRFREHFEKLGWTFETTFEAYQGKFAPLLRIPEPQRALQLMARTMYLKDIQDVNNFVRELMLDRPDVQKELVDLQSHYAVLNESYETILRIEKEIALLRPVAQAHANYATATATVRSLTEVENATFIFFGQERARLLDVEIAHIEGEIAAADAKLQEAQRVRTEADAHYILTKDKVDKGEAALGLTDLKKQLDETKKLREVRQQKSNTYAVLIEACGQGKVENEDTFKQRRKWAQAKKDELASGKDKRDRDYFLLEDSLEKQRTDLRLLENEILVLMKRPDKIPEVYRAIRDTIARAANVAAGELPFVGEMIDVDPKEAQWRPTIERLLHGFALSIIVPEKHYRIVNRFMDGQDPGRRIDYFKVIPSSGFSFQGDSRKVCHKLKIKPNAWCAGWIQSRLFEQFDHICCETPEEMGQNTRSITRNLHIRHGGDRHSRESAQNVSHRDYDILGWDTSEKVARLRGELQRGAENLRQAEVRLKQLGQERNAAAQSEKVLEKILEVLDYCEIDYASLDEKLLQLHERITALAEANDALKALREELELAQHVKEEAVRKERDCLSDKARKEERLDLRKGDRKKIKPLADDGGFDWRRHVDGIRTRAGGGELTLANLSTAENKALVSIKLEVKSNEDRANDAAREFTKAAARFLNETKDRGYHNDWDATVAHGPDMCKHLELLETEELHNETQRFSRLMERSLKDEFYEFYGRISKRTKAIKDEIDLLNETLKTIPYNEGSIVLLHYAASADKRVINFMVMLKDCLTNLVGGTDKDRLDAFAKMKLLIDHIKNFPKEALIGADAGHHLTFAIEEVSATDHSERRDYHDGGTGDSGGQKAKMAFTVLAAALCYRFRHNQSEDSNAFRLVMIDEMFGKSDEDNSQQAVDVFKKFDFQLILVCPLEGKVRLLGSHVGSYQLVSNPKRNFSSITQVTVEQLPGNDAKAA